MKKINLTLFLFAAATFCLLFGCAQTPQIDLSPPENLRVENNVLTWDEVENASSYIVSFQGTDYVCNENFYDLSGFNLEAGTALEVLAVKDGKNSVFSEPAIYYYQTVTLDTPPTLTATANLRYTMLSDQSGYEVSRGRADLRGTVVIPDFYNGMPVKKIADEAFFYKMLNTNPDTGYGCNTVTTKVVLPRYLEEIGTDAFAYCIALSEIELPATLISIGEDAFVFCRKLKEIDIPKSVTSIGDHAFNACLELAEIRLEDGIQLDYLGAGAFGNVWLENQPDGYLIINRRFLYRYKGEIPNGGVVSELPPEVEVIVGGAFSRTNLTSITIREGITLNNKSFSYCEKLSHVDLPNDLKIIPESAFSGCSALSEIALPQGLTAISPRAFALSALTAIDIPEGVTKIGEKAFSCCRSLSDIRLPTTLKFMGHLTFERCEALPKIEIPAMPELEHWDSSAFAHCSSLQEAILSDGITAIYPGLFLSCKNLTSVHIPESVTEIQNSAFMDCSSLAEIEIPKNVTSIGDSAFKNCKLLTKIVPPPNVTSIGDSVFQNCTSLTSIQLPNSLKEIGGSAFKGCISFKEFLLPDGVKKIGEAAFEDCSLLEKIQLPKSLEKISAAMFKHCQSLAEIDIPNTVTEIGDGAFAGCKNLTGIIFPEGVSKIGSYVFNGASVTEVILPSSLRELGKHIMPGKAKIFYSGSRADWETNVTENGEQFDSPYFYVELEADLPQDGGKYWHYAPDGKTPVVWE